MVSRYFFVSSLPQCNKIYGILFVITKLPFTFVTWFVYM